MDMDKHNLLHSNFISSEKPIVLLSNRAFSSLPLPICATHFLQLFPPLNTISNALKHVSHLSALNTAS